jgi:hypothetical protein
MYKKLILKNDFHNTQAVFRVEHKGEIAVGDLIELTAGQIKKAKRLLCCDGCMCSGELGTRAEWHKLDDAEIKFSYDVFYDNLTEQPNYAKLCIEKIW